MHQSEDAADILMKSIELIQTMDANQTELIEQKELVETLDGLLVRHALIHDTEVRFCPNKACQYAGTVCVDSESETIECTRPFECEKCGTRWRDPLQLKPFSVT